MAITPGTRIGVYEVVAQIGQGGMGAVYRATDTSLGRQVAIKVLPDAFAANPDRLARFEREAKTLASLNHPHIAAIYGFEKSAHQHALVMELVEGEDLSQRIARGAIPLDDALPIAQQIAQALEEAHEHGIIHRDLKPANIKVRSDGTVKVLDFGLAKAIEPAKSSSPSASLSPTITTPAMTQAGMVLGTAAYMSPEQARGIDVDKRTDLWAFGVVLWEMLTGARLFEGATVSDALAAVLRAEPPWATLPTSTPAGIKRLLRRCLEKDRKRRLDSALAGRLEIEETLTAVPAIEDGAVAAAQPSAARTTAAPWIVSAVMGLLAVVAVLYGLGIRDGRAGPPVNAVPVVVLMDTSAPRGVYDPRTRQNSGTNADDISDALGSLPVALHKETLGATWNREDQVVKQNPDLIVIHRSAFTHAMVLEFELGYSAATAPSGVPPTTTGPPPSTEFLRDHLSSAGVDKLEAFIGYVGGANPRTRFLVYSRDWPDAARVAWEQNLVRRFPTMRGRVSPIRIQIRDGTASFRDPQTIAQMTQAVQSLLSLQPTGPKQ
ncbi:MAG TPA: serine/threonine-protein kinase [Vicinamibacterales bacterium]|nr:serine/threonine-protein kinase [Vicinamibacterales bacterium]